MPQQNDQATQEDFQDPRWIRLRPSRIALTLLAAGVLLAVAATLWSEPQREFSLAWLIALGLLAGGLLVLEVRRQLLREPSAVVAFYLLRLDLDPLTGEPRGLAGTQLGLRLRLRDGRTIEDAAVVSGAFVLPIMTTVPYRLPGDRWWRRSRVLTLWADSLEREAFRQVRVQLKWR
ncbi:MAG: hypothetical protein HY255_10845 [Betaproteobacteria bacterium]|nr:hypothetical protein [Betaproteobacteria bacterium]